MQGQEEAWQSQGPKAGWQFPLLSDGRFPAQPALQRGRRGPSRDGKVVNPQRPRVSPAPASFPHPFSILSPAGANNNPRTQVRRGKNNPKKKKLQV